MEMKNGRHANAGRRARLTGGGGQVDKPWELRSEWPALGAALLLLAYGCGGASLPIGPTSGDTSALPCRDVASVVSTITTGNDLQSTEQTTCSFNRTTRSLACTSSGSRIQGGCVRDISGDSQTDYSTVGDFVDEVGLVGLQLSTRRVTNAAAAAAPSCGLTGQAIRNESVYRFDGEKRLVGYTNTARQSLPFEADLGPLTVSFLTWDAQGRPTSGISTDFPGGWTGATTYDDDARTVTTAERFVTLVARFDANGNFLRSTTSSNAGAVPIERVATVLATQRVCK